MLLALGLPPGAPLCASSALVIRINLGFQAGLSLCRQEFIMHIAWAAGNLCVTFIYPAINLKRQVQILIKLGNIIIHQTVRERLHSVLNYVRVNLIHSLQNGRDSDQFVSRRRFASQVHSRAGPINISRCDMWASKM
jgi:hypothetical protein